MVRREGDRAVVEVDRRQALEARRLWNGPLVGSDGRRLEVTTARTWGTLVDAKRWLRRPPAPTRP